MICKKILTVWVFMITYHIKVVHGLPYDMFADDLGDDMYGLPPAPPGLHYETLAGVQQNWAPGSYVVMPLGEALYSGRLQIGVANNRGGGGGNGNEGGDDGGDGDDEEDGDGNTGDEEKKRRKRDFFPNFFSQSSPKEPTTTVDGQNSNATNAAAVVQNSIATTDTNTSTNSITATSNLMNIVGIGSDVENALVIAAPYAPIVYKVATYLVPGLSAYHVILLSINVATITVEAVRNYEKGDGLFKVSTTAAYETITAALEKRSIGFGDYANDIYDSLKNVFTSHFDFRNIPGFLRKKEDSDLFPESNLNYETDTATEIHVYNDLNDVDLEALYNTHDDENLETIDIANNVDTMRSISNVDDIISTELSNDLDDIANQKLENIENNIETLDSVNNAIDENTPNSINNVNNIKTFGSINDINMGKIKIADMENNVKPLKLMNDIKSTNIQESLNPKNDIKTYSPPNDSKDTEILKTIVTTESSTKNEEEIASEESDDDIIDDSEIEIIDEGNALEEIEIDEKRFNEYLKKTMKLQPEFIQKMNGEQLMNYINNLKIKLPDPQVDSKLVFEVLTSTMDFDENVSEEEINKLIQILSKITNYFINSALNNMNLEKKTKG